MYNGKKKKEEEKNTKKGTTYYMVSGRVEEGGIGEECTQTELGRVCLRFSAESQAKKEQSKYTLRDPNLVREERKEIGRTFSAVSWLSVPQRDPDTQR